jgi:hypothetical protein
MATNLFANSSPNMTPARTEMNVVQHGTMPGPGAYVRHEAGPHHVRASPPVWMPAQEWKPPPPAPEPTV